MKPIYDYATYTWHLWNGKEVIFLYCSTEAIEKLCGIKEGTLEK